MKPQIDKRKQGFYLFLMISAYLSTSGFGVFYYLIGANTIATTCAIAFSLFVIYGVLSFFTREIVTLFRLSIFTALAAFFVQTSYTGGVYSSSTAEFIIPPLLAYFYRPMKDRYFFMVLSGLSIVALWILTMNGLTSNILPQEHILTNSLLSNLFVFAIVMIYTFLYRGALANKNKLLGESMDELKVTTEKLIHSEKMASLGVMSAGVAHEINNPLNFIKGGIEMLSKKLDGSKDHEPFIEAVEEGVKRASSIVNSLGHFSRETSAMDEECDLHEIIENCLVMLQHKLKYKVNVIKKFSVADHLKLVGNEGKLHQAILNVISNAEQAIIDEGTITIETLAKKDHLKLSISDTGVGIDKENLNKISDPFFTTKPAGSGTGLGLSITYKILEEHHAKISVSSVPLKGTNFTVLFSQDYVSGNK